MTLYTPGQTQKALSTQSGQCVSQASSSMATHASWEECCFLGMQLLQTVAGADTVPAIRVSPWSILLYAGIQK